MPDRVEKSPEEWREELPPEVFRITRQAGTERAFTGAYWNTKAPGAYLCVCCGQPLFDWQTKFDSGTGWPSFYAPVTPEAVAERTDASHGMRRTEVICARCDAHLGHVFPDGPPPSGLRYCINSASLRLSSNEMVSAEDLGYNAGNWDEPGSDESGGGEGGEGGGSEGGEGDEGGGDGGEG